MWFYLLFTGIVATSGILLYAYFWLLYVFHLALKVFYPLKSAKFLSPGYSRKIYITEASVALIVIAPTIILAFVGPGYAINGFPPIFCAISSDYRVYVIVIPVVVTDTVIVTLMIFVVYRLHVVSWRI